VRSRGYPEVAKPGNSSWMPYAPQGVKGLDDDDDDDDGVTCRRIIIVDYKSLIKCEMGSIHKGLSYVYHIFITSSCITFAVHLVMFITSLKLRESQTHVNFLISRN
jgi:hypothetical protein